jgi:uncharacterized membrane protein YhaH (DUF805 family)
MKNFLFFSLLLISAPTLAHHDGPLLSGDHLGHIGLFLIALSVLLATVSVALRRLADLGPDVEYVVTNPAETTSATNLQGELSSV